MHPLTMGLKKAERAKRMVQLVVPSVRPPEEDDDCYMVKEERYLNLAASLCSEDARPWGSEFSITVFCAGW